MVEPDSIVPHQPSDRFRISQGKAAACRGHMRFHEIQVCEPVWGTCFPNIVGLMRAPIPDALSRDRNFDRYSPWAVHDGLPSALLVERAPEPKQENDKKIVNWPPAMLPLRILRWRMSGPRADTAFARAALRDRKPKLCVSSRRNWSDRIDPSSVTTPRLASARSMVLCASASRQQRL